MYLGYRKAVLSGVAAAAVLGAGGTAIAVSTSDTTDGRASTGASVTADKQGKHAGKHKGKHNGKHKGQRAERRAARLERLDHAQVVVKDKDGTLVTRYAIHGTVTAVSSDSISVRSASDTTKTFTVSKGTKVVQRSGDAKPTKSTIAKVAEGDEVVVGGTGTGTITARRILELTE